MDKIYESKISLKWGMEAPGIDPGTSRMLSERSTIWATPPLIHEMDSSFERKIQPLYSLHSILPLGSSPLF